MHECLHANRIKIASDTFLHRLTALLTLWAFAFTTLAPLHGALLQAREMFDFPSSNADGTAVTYRYDDLGRLDEVEEGVGEITKYHYDEVGNLQSFATPNGVTHGYSYNALNRLTNLTAINAIGTIASYDYTQLRTGHRSAASESSPVAPPTGLPNTRSVKYQYDALYRLRKETITANVGAAGVADYALDAVGNRTGRTSTVTGLSQQTFTHDANDRLDSDAYDANGNTKVGQSTLNATGAETPAQTVNDIYDSENRLVSRTGPNGTVSIVYDGDGNKVRETHNATTTSYLIDTQNLTGYAQVVEELVNGNVVRTYTYGHDLLNQDQKISGTSWSATWFAYDGHGSVRQLTDGIGNVTDRYDYDAFGVQLHSAGTTFNRYRYCGEQYDDALGLYYLRARFMNASNGRFWTQDSYEGNGADPQSLHKYLYAHSNPVTNIDPSGKSIAMMPVVSFYAMVSAWFSPAAVMGRVAMASITSGAALLYGSYYIKSTAEGLRRFASSQNARASSDPIAAEIARFLRAMADKFSKFYDEKIMNWAAFNILRSAALPPPLAIMLNVNAWFGRVFGIGDFLIENIAEMKALASKIVSAYGGVELAGILDGVNVESVLKNSAAFTGNLLFMRVYPDDCIWAFQNIFEGMQDGNIARARLGTDELKLLIHDLAN